MSAPHPAPPADGVDALLDRVLARRYRILQRLGQGAMGTVYLAEHVHIRRLDAIKVLLPRLAGDEKEVARFERGARNVSRIRHPNVCTVYDFSEAEDGLRFLSMEYVPGETLQELLRREGALSPARAVDIAAQAAGALQAAHDAGIVHRDLKPANVMVSPGRDGGETVKVVDFDIAKEVDEGEGQALTQMGLVFGTPAYMSPEQLLGDPPDHRSDVYSLALVLFEMLAGSLPAEAGDTQQRARRRVYGAPPRLEDVAPGHGATPALLRALERALQVHAEDRFQSAADFARAITAALHPLPADAVILAPPPPFPAPSTADEILPPTVVRTEPAAPREAVRGTRLPSRRVRLGAAVFAALAVVAGGAWAVAHRETPSLAIRSPSMEAEQESGGWGEVDRDGDPPATPSEPRGTDDPSPHPAPSPPSAPSPTPPAGETTRRDGGSGPPPAPGDERPAPVEPAVEAVDWGAVLDGLDDRVGPPYPSEDALRGVRGEARAVWSGAVGDGERARAAIVLAHVELGLDNPAGCVEWAGRAVALASSPARRLLLGECRRVAG